MSFVHLHNHSEYSLLDGTTHFTDEKGNPSELLKTAAELKMPAMAVTDHGNLYGAIEFYEACRQAGIKPILGAEVYVSKGSRLDKQGSRRDNCHLTLLSKDYQGYQNLMALVTKGFLEGFYHDPRIDKELLAENSGGLIALSGCLKSEIAQAIAEGNLSQAQKLAERYSEILGKGNFYLELMDHGLQLQRQVNQGLLEIAKRTGLPLVATNDCHYFRKEDSDAHDARVCISTGKLLEDSDRLRFETQEFYLKSAEEMSKIFGHIPEALKNTLAIAEKCSLSIPMDQLHLPHFEVPAGFTPDTYLEKLCREGLKRKGREQSSYLERLGFELSIIRRMGFSAYFLIVRDFIHYARSQKIPVGPGRGSGAGSLVAYVLDITLIDPLEHGLLFERFLNPDRRTMPDLDIDFSDEGRDRVIEYVRQKYGSSNVAQIITFGSMHARLAVRDVGRVLAVPLQEVDRLAKLIPFGMSLEKAFQSVPDLKEALKDARLKKLFHLAAKLEGLKRHTGVHAAGTVITKEAVVKYTPLARGSSEVVTTQYDDQSLLKLGLLKIDFLGLRTLTIIDHAVRFIREEKRDFEIEKIPLDDEKSYELLRRADSSGIFQLESPGMRDLLRRMKPSIFSEIAALIALYRPGPMESGMLDEFVARKNGKKVVYEHPMMEPILKETYGTMVYQEQVMEISKRLAGFTPGQADGLRKAMGKKIKEEMEKPRSAFIEGCRKNKITPKLANKIFDQMVKFGGYGFNKSHSTAYALVSYQTAYLKANYPVEFMTALLSSEIGRSAVGAEDKENKLVGYIADTRAMGFKVLPPDVQRSRALFSIERLPDGGRAVRFGLLAVKNVGQGAAESIAEAGLRGDFSSLDDFCSRIDLRQANKKVLESLIKAGALDRLYPEVPPPQGRAQMMAQIETLLGSLSKIKEEARKGQEFLFEERPGLSSASVPAWSEQDLLKNEKEVLGFYFSGHPLRRYEDRLKIASTHQIAAIPKGFSQTVRLAGMITLIERKLTKKKGEPWARATLEDLSGEIALLVFPRTYASGIGKMLKTDTVFVAAGRIMARGEEGEAEPELIVEDLTPLDSAVKRWARGLVISLKEKALEEGSLKSLKEALRRRPGPCPVLLRVQTAQNQSALVETPEQVDLSQDLFDDLEKVLGGRTWKIESVS